MIFFLKENRAYPRLCALHIIFWVKCLLKNTYSIIKCMWILICSSSSLFSKWLFQVFCIVYLFYMLFFFVFVYWAFRYTHERTWIDAHSDLAFSLWIGSFLLCFYLWSESALRRQLAFIFGCYSDCNAQCYLHEYTWRGIHISRTNSSTITGSVLILIVRDRTGHKSGANMGCLCLLFMLSARITTLLRNGQGARLKI